MSSSPSPKHNINTWSEAPTIYASEFDAGNYVTLPPGDAPEIAAMADGLQINAPGDLQGQAAEALARVASAGAELQLVMGNVLSAQDDSDVRPTLYDLTGYWRGASARTKAVADLRSESAERALARECQAILFSDGVDFTTRASSTVLVESRVRLHLLAEAPLRAAFVKINGEWYLSALAAAHQAHLEYTTSVKQSALEPGESVEVSAAISAVRLAVLAYARWILAHVDEGKPATLIWAAKALAPIDELREQKRRQVGKTEARTEAKKEAEATKAPEVTATPAPIATPASTATPVPTPEVTVAPASAPPAAPTATKPTNG